jgi:sugar lactone lactonase YvrE
MRRHRIGAFAGVAGAPGNRREGGSVNVMKSGDALRKSVSGVGRGAALAAVLLCAALLVPGTAMAAYRQNYGFVSAWAFPVAPPTFSPLGMNFGPDGNLYVASHEGSFSSFSATGTQVATSLGSTEAAVWASGGLQYVENVAVHDGDAWVVDYNRGLAKFDTSGEFEHISMDKVPGDTYFDQAQGVAVDASGSVYVSDHGSNNSVEGFRVSKFLANGTYVTTFGDTGSVQANRLWSASSIAVGPDFQVYVADWQNGSVRRFTPNVGRSTYTLTASWKSSAFENPVSVAVDSAGNVFVLDNGSSKGVSKVSPAGVVLAHWGSAGSGVGQFTYASAVAVGPNGHIYVDDRDAGRVQEFQLLDLGPTTTANGTVTVKKGKKASFKYHADDDLSDVVKVTIKIYKGSKLKATIACGNVSQGAWHTKTWTCKLAKGSYTWKVYASDGTGHAQRNVASKTFKVK